MKKVKFLLIATLLMIIFSSNKVNALERYEKVYDLDEIVTYDVEGNQTSVNDKIIIVSGNNILTIGDNYHYYESGDYGYDATNTVATTDKGIISNVGGLSSLVAYEGVYTESNKTLTVRLSNSEKGSNLYIVKDLMFNNASKKIKIRSNGDGTFNIRYNDTHGYLTYNEQDGWTVDADKSAGKLEIYKLIDENTNRYTVNVYDEKGNVVFARNVSEGRELILPNYQLLTDLPDGYYVSGYTTLKGSNEVKYKILDTVKIEGDLDLYPVFTLDNHYKFDDNVIVGTLKEEEADEIYNGYINVYFWYGFSKTPVKNTIQYRYSKNNSVDIVIKFLSGYSDTKYKSKKEYMANSNFYSNSNYVITKILAKQTTTSSVINKDINWLTENGGLIDNVVGGSTVHVFLSPIYSTEYIVNGIKQDKLGVSNKYIINPADLNKIDGFENAVDSSVITEYEEGVDSFDVVYLSDVSKYDTEFELPSYKSNLKWTFLEKEVSGKQKVSTLARQTDGFVLSFAIVTNPNTADIINVYVALALICAGGIVLLVNFYKKNNKIKNSI